MALACTIKPLSAFLSTNLNNKIQTFDNLGDRIKRSLGYPLVSLEIHTDQLRENIQIGIEYFTKFAGYTREYLIFDSNMYEENKGIRLDLLYTLSNTNLDNCARKIGGNNPKGPGPEWYGSSPSSIYVATSTLSSSVFDYAISNPTSPTLSASLSSCFTDNIDKFELLDASLFTAITALSHMAMLLEEMPPFTGLVTTCSVTFSALILPKALDRLLLNRGLLPMLSFFKTYLTTM